MDRKRIAKRIEHGVKIACLTARQALLRNDDETLPKVDIMKFFLDMIEFHGIIKP